MSTILTAAKDFVKLLSTNATDASFPSKVPTVTEPTGDGVIDVTKNGIVYNNIILVPFGTNANDQTFKLRLIGWRKVSTLWVPVPLMQATCTLSSSIPGVSGATVSNSNYFVDTVTLESWVNSNVSAEAVSPTGNIAAHILADMKGFAKVEVTFDRNSSAASCNTLYTVL